MSIRQVMSKGLEMDAMIEFDNVQKWYGKYHALNGVSGSVNKGEVVVVCGPSGYIDFIRAQARDAGVDEARIHFERFALGEDEHPSAPVEGDTAFQVKLASTGEVFDIPADETITSALDRQGVFIPVSCEEGICGTCLTGVREGVPDHRDSYLTDAEHAANDQFTPCCSRARTPMLVLDL